MAMEPSASQETQLAHASGNYSELLDSEAESQGDNEPEWEWIYDVDQEDASKQLGANSISHTSYTPSPSPEQQDTPSKHVSRKRKRTASAWLSSKQAIIAARLGSFTVRVGDIVTLRADRNNVWVAVITEFIDSSEASEVESSDEDEDQKKARFLWLSSPKDIHNKSKRLRDTLPNERYITASTDVNPLEAISGSAVVMSPRAFAEKWPTGKIPKTDPDHSRTFVCRRGVNLRTATYTEEFIWEDIYSKPQDIDALQQKVESETKTTRKRVLPAHDLADFVVRDDEDYRSDGERGPRTPRKKRKLVDPENRTPTKRTPRKEKPTPGTTSLFETPTHRRIVEKKALEFTPLGTRILSPSQHTQLSTPHARARTSLHVSAVPTSLPCREHEFQTVYNHLESAIASSLGTTIYISGTPGTGKTATVREVVASLHGAMEREELDDFIFVEINGMKVTDPSQSYSLLWEALTGQRIAANQALTLLNQEFSRPSPRRVPCVVLMDELDQLATRNNAVMYNFFNWPGLRHSRLIVLAVANTMDLPERTLSNKISSRLGLTRVTFAGYGHAQLMRIIEARLEGVSSAAIVESDAVQFAARKVAQVSGDARRCLDICRRAVELAEADVRDTQRTIEATDKEKNNVPDTPSKTAAAAAARGTRKAHVAIVVAADRDKQPMATDDKKRGRVTIATIQRAIREATSSPLQQYLKTTPLASKLFLAALLARSRRTGIAESTLGDVLDEAKKLGSMSEVHSLREWLLVDRAVRVEDEGVVSVDETRDVPRVLGMGAAATELLEAGVIVVEERRGERGAKVRLNVGEEEVKSALKDDGEVKGLGFAT